MEEKIINLETMSKIANCFIEEECNADNIEVIIHISSPEVINRINDDFFYRNKVEGTKLDNVDEVNVNMSGVHFKYVLDNEDNKG